MLFRPLIGIKEIGALSHVDAAHSLVRWIVPFQLFAELFFRSPDFGIGAWQNTSWSSRRSKPVQREFRDFLCLPLNPILKLLTQDKIRFCDGMVHPMLRRRLLAADIAVLFMYFLNEVQKLS